MVALGTKPEHFNAVWVKNEWSRYLSLIKNGANKILIPAYRDMDPYDLPEEFSHLQAQDMSKLGFMQDLVRGIKKLASTDTSSGVKETVVVQSAASGNASALVKRGFLALEDGEWAKADEFFEQALNQNAEDAQAYLGKLMVECKARKQEDLKNCQKPFDTSLNYKKIVRFGDKNLSTTLEQYVTFILERNENQRLEKAYAHALQKINTASDDKMCLQAAELFDEISDYKDSKQQAEKARAKADAFEKDSIYNQAIRLMNENDISSVEKAIKKFGFIPDWKDAETKVLECQRKIKENKIKQETERLERERKAELDRIKKEKILRNIKKNASIFIPIVSVVIAIIVILNNFVLPSLRYNVAMNKINVGDISGYKILAKTAEYKDARICLANFYQERISAKYVNTAVLNHDGTVEVIGGNEDGQCDVQKWKDIISVSVGGNFTAGLTSKGNVVLNGIAKDDKLDWNNIINISAGSGHVVALKSDGTVVARGNNDFKQCDVTDWKDIISISAGEKHTIGLKKDGTILAIGDNEDGQCDVQEWEDIIAISAGGGHTIGLKMNGTFVATGDNEYHQSDVNNWNLFDN